MIARTKDSDSFIETFGSLEKKLMRSDLSIMIAGE